MDLANLSKDLDNVLQTAASAMEGASETSGDPGQDAQPQTTSAPDMPTEEPEEEAAPRGSSCGVTELNTLNSSVSCTGGHVKHLSPLAYRNNRCYCNRCNQWTLSVSPSP